MFFAKVYGKNTESALPLLNLLNFLSVDNVFKLHALQFAQLWHTNQLPTIWFRFVTDVHSYNTRYAQNQNFYKPLVKTNIGKKTISFVVCSIWKNIPSSFKFLNAFSFSTALLSLSNNMKLNDYSFKFDLQFSLIFLNYLFDNESSEQCGSVMT
jgi:hypothetical protein